ncbi:BBOF1 factor, partial [Atractosteus spatula]|nr:BBOF1 factor [Atractosteus spatula]
SKGNKNGKQESKVDKESDMEKAKANAALWEARLNMTEQSRAEYRDAARRLARANEELTGQRSRTEKDTVEVIAFLKKKDIGKDEMIAKLEEQLREERRKAREENEQLVKDYTHKLNELEERFKKRSNEFRMIQGELKMIKEFRKKKAQMEKELDDIKESMYVADKNHKETVARMEHRFFSEKLRLEKEAEQRIMQLAERAHNEAIVQLDDAARSVFKENVRLNEALSYHIKEAEELKKMTVAIAEENDNLAQHKETNELLVQEKVAQLKQQKEEIAELRRKVATLEEALGFMTSEFETEKNNTKRQAVIATEAGHVEISKLQHLLSMKDREMNRVKKLAKNIVEQRTEVELFFQEALDQVRKEILASRVQYKQAAQDAYLKRMQEGRAGRQEYPKIRTFNKNQHSTNSVYTDLEEAEKWVNIHSNRVDISELTWEQKEKVLRLLFAKMNGLKTRIGFRDNSLKKRNSSRFIMKMKWQIQDKTPSLTFITQAPVSELPSHAGVLPDIQTT